VCALLLTYLDACLLSGGEREVRYVWLCDRECVSDGESLSDEAMEYQ